MKSTTLCRTCSYHWTPWAKHSSAWTRILRFTHCGCGELLSCLFVWTQPYPKSITADDVRFTALCESSIVGPSSSNPHQGTNRCTYRTKFSLKLTDLYCVRILLTVGCVSRYVDVGAYGNPKRWPKPPNPSPYVESTRAVEEFVRQVGGYQMLYADS